MPSESQRVAIVREHMSWGHRFALFWLMLCLVIFGGAYALAEMGAVAAVDRPLLFIMLGTIAAPHGPKSGARIAAPHAGAPSSIALRA